MMRKSVGYTEGYEDYTDHYLYGSTLFRKDNFTPTASQKMVGNCLRIYTMLGGKDAWKIALRIVLDKSSRKA